MCDLHEGDERPGGLSRRRLLLGFGGASAALAARSILGADAAAAAAPDPALLTTSPVVQPRDAWADATRAARGPLASERPGDVRCYLVHHSGQPGNGYARSAVPDLLRGVFDHHTGPKGWSDIAYNFVVDAYGGIWEARTGSFDGPVVPDATGGTQGFSQIACFLGDHGSVEPSPQAQASMISLLALLARRDGVDTRPGATTSFVSRGSSRWPAGTTVQTRTIEGHRAMSATSCPGDAAYRLVPQEIPAAVTSLRQPPPLTPASTWRRRARPVRRRRSP